MPASAHASGGHEQATFVLRLPRHQVAMRRQRARQEDAGRRALLARQTVYRQRQVCCLGHQISKHPRSSLANCLTLIMKNQSFCCFEAQKIHWFAIKFLLL